MGRTLSWKQANTEARSDSARRKDTTPGDLNRPIPDDNIWLDLCQRPTYCAELMHEIRNALPSSDKAGVSAVAEPPVLTPELQPGLIMNRLMS